MLCSGRRVLASLAALTLAAAPAAAARPYTAEDMLAIQTLAARQPVDLSPDGRWIAYALTDLDVEYNILAFSGVRAHVVVRPTDGGEARTLTGDGTWGSYPVWSPDGRRLAFHREDDSGGQLVIWDRDSGELTAHGPRYPGQASSPPQWDGDGSRLAFSLPEAEPEAPPQPRVEVVKSSDEAIPGDLFFANTQRTRIAVLELPSGAVSMPVAEPILLRSFALAPAGGGILYTAVAEETLGIFRGERIDTFTVSPGRSPAQLDLGRGAGRLAWSPDGRSLLFAREGNLMSVSPGGGEPADYLDLDVPLRDPIWSPDGRRFALLVPDESVTDPEIEPPQPGMYTIARPFMDVYLVDPQAKTARNLTATFEDQVGEPVWSSDGRALFFVATDNATYDETLYRHDLDGTAPRRLGGGAETYSRLDAGGDWLSLGVETAVHPEDLYLVSARDGQRRQLTTLNPQMAEFEFSTPELFHYWNADGERLGALLYEPVGFSEGDQVPVVTYVYEKLTPGIHSFQQRHQILTNHGYAVLMPNVKVKVGQTATSFVKCAVPAVNAVRAMGISNGRFGIWGGSFGAFATSYLITQTDIFAAAVSRATPPELFRNWASGRDRDSRNIESGQARMGGSPFEYPERYLSQSAFFHLDKVNTPVLILHGVEDYTILFAEGEMIFYALRQLGKEAEFVIYNHGDHSLSRHSRSDTLDVHRRILEWFDRYLKTAGDAPATP